MPNRDTFQLNNESLVVKIQELQSKLQMQQAFVQYVSHEVRTPLQMISAGLALLKDDLKEKLIDAESIQSHLDVFKQLSSDSSQQTIGDKSLNADTVPTTADSCDVKLTFAADELRGDLELVEIMHASTLTAVSILNDLLLYEKVESNMLVIEQKSVDLFDTVVPAVKMFTVQTSVAGVVLTWDLDNLISVHALLDVSKFGQVIRNLISNAIKFTPKGGSVHVSAIKIAEPALPAEPLLQSVFDESACISSKKLRRAPLPGAAAAPSTPCDSTPAIVFSSKSFKGPVAQPSPPTTAMPSPITRRPSLRLLDTHLVAEDEHTEGGCAHLHSVCDAFAGSCKSRKGVDFQEKTADPTLYRISVTDSGCGISKVW